MKKKLYMFSLLLIMLGALFQLKAQEDTIIFVAPYDADNPYVYDDATNREVEHVMFLERQGFKVIRFWPLRSFELVSQDTIDMLNEADLIIIGRSGPSSSFSTNQHKAWNALTAPTLLICEWKARSSRLQFFNSGSAIHRNDGPAVVYATAQMPDDTIFSYVNLDDDDEVAWCYPPHDFIILRDSTTTNGDVVATYADEDTIPLVVRWDAGEAYYPGSDTAAGPRAYFGFGNDDTDDRFGGRYSNFFRALSKEAKKAYLAEICRLLGKEVQEPVWSNEDVHVAFVAPYNPEDPYTFDDADNREVGNVLFLENQGFKVHRFWPLRSFEKVGQDTIQMLNEFDLLIVGRSGPSSSFSTNQHKSWNALTAPTLLICPWKARSSRLQYFNSSDAIHRNTSPQTVYGQIETPDDTIFSGVTLVGDSMSWFSPPPHDFIRLRDSTTVNGDILATFEDSIPLVARWDAGEAYYPGGDTAAGPRSYIGLGNDDTQVRGKRYSNFFNALTREAKIVYLAEIARLVGVEAPDITYSAYDYNITFVAPYDPADITANREIPHIKFLEKNGFNVKEFWPVRAISLTPQDSIDMLNDADLVIIGRSGGSTNFQNDDRVAWNALTAPQMLVCQWKARSSRLKWFNSTDAIHRNTSPELVYGQIEAPDDVVFSNVSLSGDSMKWFTPPPHDFIRLRDTTIAKSNAEILATYEDSIVLLARFDAGEAFYPTAGDTAGGPRSYFGMGNDDTDVGGKDWPNFFPLPNEAQQVYFNELCHMLGVGVSEVVTVSGDARLMDITTSTGELTPAFHRDSMEYTLVIDTTVVEIGATTYNEMATIIGGDSTITDTVPGPDGAVTIYLLVEAENGVRKAYEITVQLFHTDVQEIHSDATLRIYPNPATDMLNISSENYINRVTIYNVIGQVVMDQTYRNNNHIVLNVSSLKSGLYLIKVGEGKDAIMGKFLIE